MVGDARVRQPTPGWLYVEAMSLAPEALLEQALALPASERARLASGLLASLDDEPADRDAVERLWSEETRRRAVQIASGEAALTTWEDVTSRLNELRSSTNFG
jgi:hypothetical protein